MHNGTVQPAADLFNNAARRYFPMPDYDLSQPGSVKMTVYGGVVE